MEKGDKFHDHHRDFMTAKRSTFRMGGMKQDVQPGSDSVASRRAGMSPSSSLLFVLHVHGVVTEGSMLTQVHDG